MYYSLKLNSKELKQLLTILDNGLAYVDAHYSQKVYETHKQLVQEFKSKLETLSKFPQEDNIYELLENPQENQPVIRNKIMKAIRGKKELQEKCKGITGPKRLGDIWVTGGEIVIITDFSKL